MPDDTERFDRDLEHADRERKAREHAYHEGREAARIEARFERIETRAEEQSNALRRIETGQAALGTLLTALADKQKARDAVADAFRAAAAKQVSTRDFYVGLGLLIVALTGLLLGTR